MEPVTPIVGQPSDSAPDPGVYGWDWTATTHELRSGIVDDLCVALGAQLVLPGKGLHGWARSLDCYDAGGYHLGAVYFGNSRDDVHVLSTSAAAHQARPSVVSVDPDARTSRVDTRVDTLVPFEELEARLWEQPQLIGSQGRARKGYDSKLTRYESFDRDRNSLGRTLYLGAPTSAIRVRIYEKWLESPGQYVEGTNRVEVQLRPASKVKQRVSSWSPAQTFCASRAMQDLAELVGADATEAGSLHVQKDVPTLEQSLAAMGTQYGPAVSRWLEHSAGDFSKVVEHLLARHDEFREPYSPGTNEPAPVARDGSYGPVERAVLGA